MRAFVPRSLALVAEASARRPRAVLVLVIVAIVAAAVYLAQNLAVETGTDAMLDPHLEFRQQLAEFQAAFPNQSDTFVALVEAPIPEAAEVAATQLATRLRATASILQVDAPSIDPFFRREGLLYLDVDALDQRLAELADAQALLASLAEAPDLPNLLDVVQLALGEAAAPTPMALTNLLDGLEVRTNAAVDGESVPPLSWRNLMAGSAEPITRHVITIRPRLDPTKLQPAKEALADAAVVAREIEAAVPGAAIAFTGKIALNAEELSSVTDGAMIAGVASMVLVTLILGFGLRSGRLVGAILMMLVAGLLVTGVFGLVVFGQFNLISVAFAVLFIGLGIDFAIHYGLRYQEERGRGLVPVAAAGESAATAGMALALCAPTTAMAFLAFTPTAYVGLAQLGAIAAFGMVISLVMTLTTLPALLVFMGVPPLPPRAARPRSWLSAGVRRALIALALILAAVALTQVSSLRFDADPLRLKDAQAPSVLAFQRLAETEGSSPYRINLLVADRDEAASVAARLEALPEVGNVLWIERFVPKDQDIKLALVDDARLFLAVPEAMPATPADPAAIREAFGVFAAETKERAGEALAAAAARATGADDASLGALQEAVFHYWPKLLDDLATALEATGVGVNDLPAAVRDRYVAADGRLLVEVLPAEPIVGPEAMTRFVDAVQAVAPAATGGTVQAVRGGEAVEGAMLQATTWALIAIVVFLGLTLRSFRAVLLVLVPVALATLLTLGLAVALGLDFNFANVIVLPLLIGFGVDSAIHVVLRAQEDHEHDPLEGTTTPRAVVLSALTTIGSFGTLALSPHAGTASMGQLLTISVLATMVASLLVLPAAVRLVGVR